MTMESKKLDVWSDLIMESKKLDSDLTMESNKLVLSDLTMESNKCFVRLDHGE